MRKNCSTAIWATVAATVLLASSGCSASATGREDQCDHANKATTFANVGAVKKCFYLGANGKAATPADTTKILRADEGISTRSINMGVIAPTSFTGYQVSLTPLTPGSKQNTVIGPFLKVGAVAIASVPQLKLSPGTYQLYITPAKYGEPDKPELRQDTGIRLIVEADK